MAARALDLWKENEKRWNQKLFHRTGVLWMTSPEDAFEKTSLPLLREAGISYEELSAAEARRRFPQINFENVKWCIWEPESGFLTARRNCQTVLEHFLAEGGEYREASVTPGAVQAREMNGLALSDGTTLSADQYVFACGPWLGKLFPDVIGNLVRPTRQEVFFFGTPAGDARYSEGQMPAWIDHCPNHIFYGIPGTDWRGFKAADDTRGPDCDPTTQERTVSPEALAQCSRSRGVSFSWIEGRPGGGNSRLPIRRNARRELHHRSPSRRGQRVACGRRIGPRLQTWASRRGTRRANSSRQESAGSDLRPRAIRALVPHFATAPFGHGSVLIIRALPNRARRKRR